MRRTLLVRLYGLWVYSLVSGNRHTVDCVNEFLVFWLRAAF
jgi:hypothetical protein